MRDMDSGGLSICFTQNNSPPLPRAPVCVWVRAPGGTCAVGMMVVTRMAARGDEWG